MPEAAAAPAPAPKRRWRPRFALGGLLLFILFLGSLGALYFRPPAWRFERELSGFTSIQDVPGTFYLLLRYEDGSARLWDPVAWQEVWAKPPASYGYQGYILEFEQTESGAPRLFELLYRRSGSGSTIEYEMTVNELEFETLSLKSSYVLQDHVKGNQLVLGHEYFLDHHYLDELRMNRDVPIRLRYARSNQVVHAFKGTFDVRSPDDRFMVSWERSAGDQTKIYLYDVPSRELLCSWEPPPGFLHASFLNRNTFYSLESDGRFRIFEAPSGREIACVTHPRSEWALLSPSGQQLMSTGMTQSKLWNLPAGTPVAEWPYPIYSLSMSPDQTRLVVRFGGNDQLGNQLLDARTGRTLCKMESSAGDFLFLSDDLLCLKTLDGKLQRWMRERPEWTHRDPLFWLAISLGVVWLAYLAVGTVCRIKRHSTKG